MAKFDAGTAVERLEYDFTAYGGNKGEIHEPSTGDVNRFFTNMRKMMREVQALSASVKDLDELEKIEELDDETLTRQVNAIDEATEGASEYQTRTIEHIAELCGGHREYVENPDDPSGDKIEVIVGGSPSMEDLSKLPYRVLQAFTNWLMEEIKPKKTTPATKR